MNNLNGKEKNNLVQRIMERLKVIFQRFRLIKTLPSLFLVISLAFAPFTISCSNNVNDLGTSPAKYEAAVENIIRRLLSLDKKPLIMYYHAATPYTPDDGTQWPVVVSAEARRSWDSQESKKADIDAICAKYGVPTIDYLSFFRENTNDARDEIMTTLYKKDNVHPKEAGYQLMGTFSTCEFDANPAKYFVKHNWHEDLSSF